MMRRVSAASLSLIVLLFAVAAGAVQPDEMLKDPAQEARARALSEQIRCLVCQNQSIDDSEASLAHDLRLLVRDQIRQGRSDAQIRDFLVKRYGAFVLLKPPFRASTLVLWLGPLFVLLAGATGLVIYIRGRNRTTRPADSLSAEELARVERLLHDGDGRA
jgi:cytochrome c-type biogenesis protein CcmH